MDRITNWTVSHKNIYNYIAYRLKALYLDIGNNVLLALLPVNHDFYHLK